MKLTTRQVRFGRGRLNTELAKQIEQLPQGIRGRLIAFVLHAHCSNVSVQKVVEAADALHRLGVLINQSLKVSRGSKVDEVALAEAVALLKGLYE